MRDVTDRRSQQAFRDALQREVFHVNFAKERLHDLLVDGVRVGLITTHRAREIRQQIEAGHDSWESALVGLGRS